jgi:arsenate reductase
MNKAKVLFICVHNSARSQMAEAFLNDICGAEFEAQSAGLEPGTLNPLVVEVMREAGLDISRNKTQAVFDVFKSGQLFAYVVTVCSEAEAGGCPIFPGPAQRLHWPFPDPSGDARGKAGEDPANPRCNSGARRAILRGEMHPAY